MNARIGLRTLLFLASMLGFAEFSRADAPLDALVAKLQEKYHTMEAFKADFAQTYQSKRFSSREMSEKGVVYLKKGALLSRYTFVLLAACASF